MLPTHYSYSRLSGTQDRLSRLKLSLQSRPFFGKPLFRWILVACTTITLLWLATPLFQDYVPVYRPIRIPWSQVQEEDTPSLWDKRKEEVREAFKHAWKGYKSLAFPYDELLAVSGGRSNKFNGWSLTLFDSLDTIYIMGLEEEFADAMASIKDVHFTEIKPDMQIPFFETTIRYLGGLLSAYALSGEKKLLELADELGGILLPTFNVTQTGLPVFSVNIRTGKPSFDYSNQGKQDSYTILFAEAASCQLEFKYLAKLTGKKEYYEPVEKIMNILYDSNVPDGLFSERLYTSTAKPWNTKFSVGAGADSGYEYLLKQWILTGDVKARDQYVKSIDGIMNNLLYMSSPSRQLLYVADMENNIVAHRLEHLSCFLPGVLALGTKSIDLPPDVKEKHEWAAHGLAYTCAMTYLDMNSGLGGEIVGFLSGPPETGRLKWVDEVAKWKSNGRVGLPPGMAEPPSQKNDTLREYYVQYPDVWLLRPEVIESIFVMYRTTGDVKWRERGYEIFQSIVKHAKTEYGFASLAGIKGEKDSDITKIDDMPSYFLAETLKYLYLLFSDVDHLDNHSIALDKWVFNTEAHPLPRFEWTEKERKLFNIPIGVSKPS